MNICSKCGQTSLTDLTLQWEGKEVCRICYDRLYAGKFSWSNKNLAILMEIGCSYTDYEEVLLPFEANIDAKGDLDYDIPVTEIFEQLVEDWTREKWGYEGEVRNMQLVSIEDTEYKVENPSDTVECAEFWKVQAYKELAFESELYDRPFDSSPNGDYFSSSFAEDCMKGEIYSKDFRYSYCESCQRWVCEQNPSNGWHSQGHFNDFGFECNKCYEERVLEHGVNDDYNSTTIPGQFFNTETIEEKGWELVKEGMMVGSGHTGHRDPKYAHEIIQGLIDDDNLVLINYGSMAIGGLGGYIDIYKKKKADSNESAA